jgi:phospholipid/cholesterol/gamma-HCH transport system permease protein
MTPATVDFRWDARALVLALSGDWRVEGGIPGFDALVGAARAATDAPAGTLSSIACDGEALGAWDSGLLVFLRRGESFCAEAGCAFDTARLPARISTLLSLARAVPERAAEPESPAPSFTARVGGAGIAAWDTGRAALQFLGEVAGGLGRVVRGRGRMQWRAFWVVVQSNASGALPIVTLIALLVGIIIAFLGVVVLQRFGAGYYVSYLVGYGMLREMGALMTGIIIAGRTGAGFAAELGSMKVTEELDAYATLGISPIDHLVLPRILGLAAMMPLLVLYADAVGILGGLAVAVAMLNVSAAQFAGGLLAALSLSDALLGVFKSALFGVIIGLAGSFHGLRTGSDASAVGRAATSAVVLGIVLIVLTNAVVDWLAALWLI